MEQLRVLFWNTARSAPPDIVALLVYEQDVDIVLLAEPAAGLATMVRKLNEVGAGTYEIPVVTPERLHVFVRMPADRVKPIYDGANMTIRHVQPVLGLDFILAAVHFPSKLTLDAEEQALLCSRWTRHIIAAEERAGHQRTMIVGDLNMNPFELGVVGSEGLHAVSSREVASRRSRVVAGEERHLFYNPMWSLLGDYSPGPPGTYYYSASKPVTYFWNTFDQVLLRPTLSSNFHPGDVNVVTSIDGRSLLTTSGVPDREVSDHLPLITILRLEDYGFAQESMG